MSMTITLSPHTELALADQARKRGQRAEDYAAQMLQEAIAIRSPGSSVAVQAEDESTPTERLAALEALIGHVRAYPPGTHFVDDSRDSIYDGPDGRGYW